MDLDDVEAWAREECLAPRGQVEVGEVLGRFPSLPADDLEALMERWRAAGNPWQVAPGLWLDRSYRPRLPSRAHLPRLRLDGGRLREVGAGMQELLEESRDLARVHGHWGIRRTLLARDIKLGCWPLTAAEMDRAARLPVPFRVVAGEDREDWWIYREGRHLFGPALELLLGDHVPGDIVEIAGVGQDGSARMAFRQLGHDARIALEQQSELEIGEVKAATWLESMREVLAAVGPAGLPLAAIVAALEAGGGDGWIPKRKTISGLLSKCTSFRRRMDGHWYLAQGQGALEPPDAALAREAGRWVREHPDLSGQDDFAQFQILVMTLGGSPEPLRHALSCARTRRIVFLTSESAAHVVEDVLRDHPAMAAGPEREVVLLTDDEKDDIQACRAKAAGIFQGCREAGIAPAEACVDFTGGTKAMSAGLVLAAREFGMCRSLYVAGARREKDGTGVVVTGTERPVWRWVRP